jgi:hypothetical protein
MDEARKRSKSVVQKDGGLTRLTGSGRTVAKIDRQGQAIVSESVYYSSLPEEGKKKILEKKEVARRVENERLKKVEKFLTEDFDAAAREAEEEEDERAEAEEEEAEEEEDERAEDERPEEERAEDARAEEERAEFVKEEILKDQERKMRRKDKKALDLSRAPALALKKAEQSKSRKEYEEAERVKNEDERALRRAAQSKSFNKRSNFPKTSKTTSTANQKGFKMAAGLSDKLPSSKLQKYLEGFSDHSDMED